MSLTFLLVVSLAYAAVGQGTLGGLYNGLRYTFTYGSTGIGSGCAATGRPGLPSIPGGTASTGQLCFFFHEKHYIYSTDCANTIFDRYVWMGKNSSLPDGGYTTGTGAGISDYRYISDGTYQNLTYTYSGFGSGSYLYNNRYYAITTDETHSTITSFIYYAYYGGSLGCSYSYSFTDGAYKPYTAYSPKYTVYRTTNRTGYGASWCGYGTGTGGTSGYGSSVCISNCPGTTSHSGWFNMPTVVCIGVDRHNSYHLTNCLGTELSSLWWTRGGYPVSGTTPSTPSTPSSGTTFYGNYTPYDFPGNSRFKMSLTLSYGYGTGTSSYSGYYLTATTGNTCGATWRLPLSVAEEATAQPNLVPLTGLYRLYSNVPYTGLNNYHFYGYGTGSGYSTGFAGGITGWNTYCNADNTAINTIWDKLGSPKVTQMCLLQTAVNTWTLNDCRTYDAKTYITFGWNGVSWTGYEGANPIEISFDADGRLTSWTGIYNTGMCQYTFTVMWYGAWDPPAITNGKYDRTFAPYWDFLNGNRYDFGYGYGSYYSFDDYTYGNCTDIPSDTVCTYNFELGLEPIETDCQGKPVNWLKWSGYVYETPAPYGVDPMRGYEYIDPASITETGYTSYWVRGGCTWEVTNTLVSTISGPAVAWGHYTASGSSSLEGSCLPWGDPYHEVGIYPSGLPWQEYAIQDWATGEVLVILKWDGSTYNGWDKLGRHIVGIPNEDGSNGWYGIYGESKECVWTVIYDFETNFPVLPRIQSVPASVPDWHFSDAYGVYNGMLDGGGCAANDDDLKAKYNTLICVWPNGPAVLNLVQCNDKRDDYQTILQQAWWKGGLNQWEGKDYQYSYTWGYLQNDDGDYDEITFIIKGQGDDGCEFELTLWRGDDCETNGWKTGICILSVLCAFLLLVALYFITAGGGGGGSGGGGYHEYQ